MLHIPGAPCICPITTAVAAQATVLSLVLQAWAALQLLPHSCSHPEEALRLSKELAERANAAQRQADAALLVSRSGCVCVCGTRAEAWSPSFCMLSVAAGGAGFCCSD